MPSFAMGYYQKPGSIFSFGSLLKKLPREGTRPAKLMIFAKLI